MSDLRELFHRLRDEELPVAGVQLPAGNGQRATGNFRWAFAALVVIAIVVGAAIAHHRRRPPVAESIVTWTAPTDFLLRTPGSELLSSVPQIPERKE
jgi:hypothetical protein